MSRQQSAGIEWRRSPDRVRTRRVGIALVVIVGLAACGGDDDDAADSTSTSDTIAAEATTAAPESTAPPEITGASDTTLAEGTEAPTGDSAPAASDPQTAGTADPATEAAAAPAPAAAAPAEASGSSAASDGAATPAGPTTTGPPCEFEENSSLPLERCNMGPAVAVVQSILQAAGYAIETVDGDFGDQTLNAVRAFQEDEGLTVDGTVTLETWTALDVGEQFGNDDDGDGIIGPDELDFGP